MLADDRRNPLPSMCIHDKELTVAALAATAALQAAVNEAQMRSPKNQWSGNLTSMLSTATSKVRMCAALVDSLVNTCMDEFGSALLTANRFCGYIR